MNKINLSQQSRKYKITARFDNLPSRRKKKNSWNWILLYYLKLKSGTDYQKKNWLMSWIFGASNLTGSNLISYKIPNHVQPETINNIHINENNINNK